MDAAIEEEERDREWHAEVPEEEHPEDIS